MNQSNSKLNKDEKIILREMKLDFDSREGEIFSYPETGVTIAIEHKGVHTSRVSMSVMSPDEKKFRRKVGEYHALNNLMYNDRFMTVPRVDALSFALYLAEYFGA